MVYRTEKRIKRKLIKVALRHLKRWFIKLHQLLPKIFTKNSESKKYPNNKKQHPPSPYEINNVLSPVRLLPEIIELGKRLDALYSESEIKSLQRPSKILEGAFYAIRPECRSNPDWMSQAAHSFRELIYPFHPASKRKIGENKILYWFLKYTKNSELSKNISFESFIETFKKVDELYGFFQDITHHGVQPKKIRKWPSEEEFLNKSKEYVIFLSRTVELQSLYIHAVIDAILKRKPSRGIEDAINLFNALNFEGKAYFFAKADERWLKQLWSTGLLDSLKKERENISIYTTPEIEYLVRMAKSKNLGTIKRVIDIITDESLATSEDNFNPELVGQIFHILADWPAEYIIETLEKLDDRKIETWIKLMSSFGMIIHFSLKEIFEKLLGVKEYAQVLRLSKAILSVGKKDTAPPFYLDNLQYIGVFETIKRVLEENPKLSENIFIFFSEKYKDILNIAPKSDGGFFEVADRAIFKLYFPFSLINIKFPSDSDFGYTTKAFFYLLTTSWEKLVEIHKDNGVRLKKVFQKNIGFWGSGNVIPKSFSSWKFRLYALSLKADIFKEELEDMLFSPLEIQEKTAPEKANIVLSKTLLEDEYLLALERTLEYFSVKDGKRYLALLKNAVLRISEKQDLEAQLYAPLLKPFKERGGFEKEIKEIEEIIGLQTSERHFSSQKNIEEDKWVFKDDLLQKSGFGKKIKEISWEELIEELNTRFLPHRLLKEGEREVLWGIEKAILEKAEKDPEGIINVLGKTPEKLDSHYLYFILRGLNNIPSRLRRETKSLLINSLNELVDRFEHTGINQEKQQSNYHHLFTLEDIVSLLPDIAKRLLEDKNTSQDILEKHKREFFRIVKFLLLNFDTELNKEEKENREATNRFFLAVNTIKGRGFEALVLYIWHASLTKEIKNLVERVVAKEKSKAMMFLYGYFLYVFYYKDKSWTLNVLVPNLFKEKTEDQLLAFQEGYLSQNVYKEMFEEDKIKKEFYEKWIKSEHGEYSDGQAHFKHPDEGLASHLAIAFVFLGFDIGAKLFHLFWNKGHRNTRRWKEFILAIGRILKTNENTELIKNSIEKLLRFWGWAIKEEYIAREKDVISAFGSWINLSSLSLFETTLKQVGNLLQKTIKLSEGKLEYGYDFIEALVKLYSEKALNSEAFLEILTLFFVPGEKEEAKERARLLLLPKNREVLLQAMKEIYKYDKDAVEKVLSILFSETGEVSELFWFLEDVSEK